MKKYIVLIMTFASLGLTAFGLTNWNIMNTIIQTPENKSTCAPAPPPVDFVYKVESRFLSTITKEKLDAARTILDILPPVDIIEKIESYGNIEVSTFNVDRKNEIKLKSDNEILTADQLQLIQSLDYGANFYITGHYHRNYSNDWGEKKDTIVRYMTVTPKKEATYKTGVKNLIQYLQKNSKEVIALAQKENLQPGKISFKVTRDGKIDQVALDYTSGYASIDNKMLELIREMPGTWEAATDAKGQKVEQVLVFFFGLMGC